MTARQYIASLHPLQQDYAKAYLAWLREETETNPWEGAYGLSFKPAQTIRRKLGSLAG